MPRSKYKVIVIRSTIKGQCYWRLEAQNGRTLAHSETYSNITSCRRTAQGIQHNLTGSIYVEE